jgi:uncharacterized protein (TIGR03382 family)
MLRPTWTAALTCLASLATPGLASAYVLAHDQSGSSIRWDNPRVDFLFDPTSRDLAAADVLAAAQRALAHWEAVVPVTITVTAESGHGTPGYDLGHPGQNHNEIFFVDDVWDLDEGVIATTLVTMDSNTHQILDTDILINGAEHRFAILPDSSQAGTGLDDDLESALTHELGHALGLAHNPSLPVATMFPLATRGEVSERQLSADDIAGAQSLYDVTAPKQPAVGCSTAGGPGLLSLLVVLVLALGRPSRADPLPGALAITGEVQSATAEWHSGVIVTRVAVGVSACHRGDCPARVEFDVVGGRIGSIEQRVSDHEVPAVGDRLDVELGPSRSGALRLTKPLRITVPAAPRTR